MSIFRRLTENERISGWLVSHTAMDGANFFIVTTKNAPEGSGVRYIGNVFGSIGITILGLAPLWPFARRPDRRALWRLVDHQRGGDEPHGTVR